jgi:hypothetical protein
VSHHVIEVGLGTSSGQLGAWIPTSIIKVFIENPSRYLFYIRVALSLEIRAYYINTLITLIKSPLKRILIGRFNYYTIFSLLWTYLVS